MIEFLPFKQKWSEKLLIEFSRLMKVQIRNGIPLIQGVRLIKDALPNKVSDDLDQFVLSLEHGEAITVTLEMLHFPSTYLSLLKIGESHGDLALAFEQCERYYQQKVEYKHSLRNAISYPVFLLLLIILLFVFFTTILLPQFLQLYKTLQIDIPITTQMILSFYAWFSNYNWWVFLSLIGVAISIFLFFRQAKNQRKMKKWLLQIPVFRRYFLQRYTYLFSSNLSLFLNHGISLTKGLYILADSKDILVKESSERIKNSLFEGWSLADSLANEKLFMLSFVEMVQFYETVGSLDIGLKQYSDQLQNQMETELKEKLKWLEPILISMTGVFVFLLIYILFSPIFSLIQSI